MASSSSSAPNAADVNEVTTTVKRTAAAAALGPAADPAPRVKRQRKLWFTSVSPPPSSVKAAASSPSPSAVRCTRTPTTATTSSSVSVKAAAGAWARLASSRSPTRFFAGKSAPRLVRGVRTPGPSRSAGKAATPAGRGTPRTATAKQHMEAKLSRLRDGGISSEIRKELTEGRDAAATIAASVLQEASIFDSLLRNESEFSEICNSANVSNPLPTFDPFLSAYEETIQWKNVAKCMASVELSSAKYWIGGGPGPHVVHELSLPNAPKTESTVKERTAELAKDLCGQMQRWFLAFVEDALDVENKWKHSCDTQTLVSQFRKISHWLEQTKDQIVDEDEEWTKEMIKRLDGRIVHNVRRLKEWGAVPPRTQSRRSHQ